MDESAENQTTPTSPARGRLKVLVADDSPEFLVAATEYLKTNPRLETVGMALSGEEAVRLAHRVNPDLVLVDYKMSEMNGAETTEQLKKLDPAPRVVVVTGHDNGDIQARVTAAGADAFLLKDEFLEGLDPLIETMFFPGHQIGRESLSENLGQRIRKLNRDATIVLVDDDFVTQELVDFLLTEAGYRVFKAGTGNAGLELIRTHRPELVLLDVGLPDVSGIEVCRQIKTDPALRQTLVMHLSATHTSEQDMEKGIAGGADAYFTLPFQKEQLLARVDSLVRIARLESAMSANATFFDHLFEKSNFGVAHAAPNGRIQSINEPLRQLLGLEENWKISGKCVHDLAFEQDQPTISRALENLQSEEFTIHRGEYRFHQTEDIRIWVRLTVFPQRDGTGKVAHLTILFEDITPQKNATAIQEAMLESIPASIALLDPRGKILATNRSWDDHFAALRLDTRSLTAGGNFLDYCASLADSHGSTSDDLIKGLTKVLDKKSGMFEADYSRGSDRSQKWFRITANPMDESHSEGGLVMHMDITEKHKLEHQLRQSQKMDALGQLAGGVAHDFSNLLMVIRCNSDILGRPNIRAEISATCIRDIQTAAKRASNLTRQLLAFSRQQPMELREIDLSQSVTNLVSMLQRLLGESVTLVCDIAKNLPATMGDAGMIDQILINLAVNARDAMADGGDLTISLKTVRRHPPKGQDTERTDRWIELSATDTGAGIPPELREKVFEPFFTTKATNKGTGLGLATVHGIVKQHNGWIELDSQLNQGTQFRIFLPAIYDLADEGTTHLRRDALEGKGQGILVIEDDADVLSGIVRTFNEVGFKVWAAATAEEALAHWQEHHAAISLVVADIVLPGGRSGEVIAEEFRRQKPDLIVLLTSGYKSEPSRIVCDERTRFLQKPYSLEELSEVVSQYFDEH
jgi:PAS domain S-box-containing protein